MTQQQRRTILGRGLLAALPLCALLLAAGCSKSPDTAGGPPVGRSNSAPGGMPGGRRMGGPGGPGVPVAANASGAQIYQQKCTGCHGNQGQGARGPALKRALSRPEAELSKIIRDGRGRMPAFASQLTPAQITKVAAYVKQLKPG